MCAANRENSRYKLETVARACTILHRFTDAQQSLSLSEVVDRTGFERTIVFRILKTLEEEGLLRRPEGRRYFSNVNIVNQKRFRIGYASQNNDSFSRAVTHGIRWAATRHQVDLIEVENRYSARTALRNAHRLALQKVDLAIECQVYERIGLQLSTIYEEASIPVIAVEIPQPGAVFFGIDNYNVGQMAGKALVKAARQHWQGEIDELLMLDLEVAGSLPHLCVSGAESAVRKLLTGSYHILHLDSRGELERSFELVRKHLQFSRNARHSFSESMISLFWVRFARSLKLAGASSVLHWEWVLSRRRAGNCASTNKDDRFHCYIPGTVWRQSHSGRIRYPPSQTGPAGHLCAGTDSYATKH